MTDTYRPNLNTPGYLMINEYIGANYKQVRETVAETIDTYVEGIVPMYAPQFHNLTRHILKGLDSEKDNQPHIVDIALKTTAVTQFIVAAALPHSPELKASITIDRHIEQQPDPESMYISLIAESRRALESSDYFSTLLTECKPSVDPDNLEPEVVSLFGGFILLALGDAEELRAQKIKEDMEAELTSLKLDDSDIARFFDS